MARRSSRRSGERGAEKENYHFVECSYGAFQRSLRLPYAVNPEEVKADFSNGVLTITLPKTAQQLRSRKIQVGQGAQPGQQIASGGVREPQRPADPPPERKAPAAGEQPSAH